VSFRIRVVYYILETKGCVRNTQGPIQKKEKKKKTEKEKEKEKEKGKNTLWTLYFGLFSIWSLYFEKFRFDP
jgi:hypothetical protein